MKGFQVGVFFSTSTVVHNTANDVPQSHKGNYSVCSEGELKGPVYSCAYSIMSAQFLDGICCTGASFLVDVMHLLDLGPVGA